MVYTTDQLEAFREAYWLSKPKPVRALRSMEPASTERYKEALALVGAKHIVDPWIDAWGTGNPLEYMQGRVDAHIPWVPKMGSDKTVAVIVMQPWETPASYPCPEDGIPTSVNIAAYKPIDPVVVEPEVPVVQPTNPIDFNLPLSGGCFAPVPNDPTPVGTIVEQGGKKYRKEGWNVFGGWMCWYKPVGV
jgi:hypothetical protein